MKPESIIQNEQRLEISKLGGKAYRNNSGVLKNPEGVPVRFGLGNDSPKIIKVRKSSDLICGYPVTITPSMVGHRICVLMADECKKEGWRYTGNEEETAQKNFLDAINKMGGIGFFAQSTLDLKNAINAFYARFK